MRLGQRISTLWLDGVLCSEYKEGIVELESLLADGYLTLLHRLEQSTLHLGRSTVDLIGKDKVGKHRTALDLELLLRLAIDHCTHNVGGQEVGSELYAVILGIDKRSKCLDSQCLGKTGNTLEQDVTIRQKTYQQRVNEVFLSYYNSIHAHCDGVHKCAFAGYQFIEFSDIYCITHNV